MNHLSKIALALTTAMLAACAGTYEPPGPTQPRARLRIVQKPYTDNTRLLIIELPDQCLTGLDPSRGDKYNLVAALSGKGNLSPQTRGEIGMANPPAEKNSFSEVYIAAGKRFYYASYFESSFTSRSFNSCYIGTSFQPEAGADYLAFVELVPGGCQHTVLRLGSDGAVGAPVETERVRQVCVKK